MPYTQGMTIDIPLDIMKLLNQSKVEQEIRRYLAVRLYVDEAITIGKAAELAGMRRLEFEDFIARHNIPVSLLDYSDIHADLERMGDSTLPVR
jgi:predicted HTH domain antitoxin